MQCFIDGCERSWVVGREEMADLGQQGYAAALHRSLVITLVHNSQHRISSKIRKHRHIGHAGGATYAYILFPPLSGQAMYGKTSSMWNCEIGLK